jgi:hypothetical protein
MLLDVFVIENEDGLIPGIQEFMGAPAFPAAAMKR